MNLRKSPEKYQVDRVEHDADYYLVDFAVDPIQEPVNQEKDKRYRVVGVFIKVPGSGFFVVTFRLTEVDPVNSATRLKRLDLQSQQKEACTPLP